jgi:hypothetical protein
MYIHINTWMYIHKHVLNTIKKQTLFTHEIYLYKNRVRQAWYISGWSFFFNPGLPPNPPCSRSQASVLLFIVVTNLYFYLCKCIYICIYIYIHIYVYIYIHIYINIHTYICTSVCVYSFTYIHIYVFINIPWFSL